MYCGDLGVRWIPVKMQFWINPSLSDCLSLPRRQNFKWKGQNFKWTFPLEILTFPLEFMAFPLEILTFPWWTLRTPAMCHQMSHIKKRETTMVSDSWLVANSSEREGLIQNCIFAGIHLTLSPRNLSDMCHILIDRALSYLSNTTRIIQLVIFSEQREWAVFEFRKTANF